MIWGVFVRKHVGNILFFTLFVSGIELVAVFLIKGPIDLFNSGHYYIFRYVKLLFSGALGNVAFFTLIEIISAINDHFRHRARTK